MTTSLKEEILILRKNGKNYNEICEILNCSKGTVAYHCNNNNIGGNYVSKIKEKLSEVEIEELNTYYINHSIDECVIKFNLGRSTVIKHTKNKYVKLNDDEIKHRNYNKVKTHRQRLKEKSIEYKGGCCEKCGYDRCNSALEFHHLNPNEKDFGIGSYSVLSWEKIKLELDKCIMVCANCHREIHHNLFGT
jgi:DNA-binding CsgD family transcriptional regulator